MAEAVAHDEIAGAALVERGDKVGADEPGAAGDDDHADGYSGFRFAARVRYDGAGAETGRSRMQGENRLFDDLARVASGALGTITGVRGEIETRFHEQMERVLARMNLVRREEFDAVQAMAAKARLGQEMLEARVAALEARLAALDAAPADADAPSTPD